MNQQPETMPSESASAPAVDQTHLQYLDGLLEAFRRESEQTSVLFQSAVVASQEGAVKRVAEMRAALAEELQGIQQNILSKAKLEADEVIRRANSSAEELLGLARAF